MHIHRGRCYRADGNCADGLAALGLLAVDNVSGESAKRQTDRMLSAATVVLIFMMFTSSNLFVEGLCFVTLITKSSIH
jgi:hypothetical protein